jgi:hypothetical protein
MNIPSSASPSSVEPYDGEEHLWIIFKGGNVIGGEPDRDDGRDDVEYPCIPPPPPCVVALPEQEGVIAFDNGLDVMGVIPKAARTE